MPLSLAPMRRAALLPLFALAFSAAAAAQPPQIVILVRHAERPGNMNSDAGISKVGRCRAEVLAKMLADTGIKRIYVSEVARTQQTAEPLAKRLGLNPEVVPANDVDALVSKLRAASPPGVALVVGHSNTVPEIIRRLGGGTVPMKDNEFDRMFVAILTGPAQASVLAMRYPGCPQ